MANHEQEETPDDAPWRRQNTSGQLINEKNTEGQTTNMKKHHMTNHGEEKAIGIQLTNRRRRRNTQGQTMNKKKHQMTNYEETNTNGQSNNKKKFQWANQ